VSTHYFRLNFRNTANPRRCQLLERLLARADGPTAVTDWRAAAFRIIAPQVESMPAVGAVALRAACGVTDAVWVFMATPVHYVAEMNNVRLSPDGILSLDRAEAEALADDFNRVWNNAGIRLLMGRSADLFCICDQPLPAKTNDPEDVLGQHIERYLPTDAHAPRLRQLMSEIEMWLFDHVVNQRRIARAAPPVNGLWLWGGGATLASLPSVQGWTAGDDVFFRAFPVRTIFPRGEAARTPSAVMVLAEQPGTHTWSEIESRWLGPALAELRSGRTARLDLSAGDRCFSVSGRSSWRLWRRPRAWWDYFA
jgi:hypothetical protein